MTINSTMTALANSIRTKSGVSGALSLADMKTAVDSITTGGGTQQVEAIKKDINFYDYDGFRLYSYNLSDLPLTALPAGPDHSGNEVPLTFQQWTHTLDQVNACTTKLDVGASLITTDEKTHIFIFIADDLSTDISLRFSQTLSAGVEFDWGDGSATETITGTGVKNGVHSYATAGEYHITLTVALGCVLGLGSASSSYCLMGLVAVTNRTYCNQLQKIYIGERVIDLPSYAFNYCYSLSIINIPYGIKTIGTSAFSFCYHLTHINVPSGITSVGSSAFNYCASCKHIVFPEGLTGLPTYTFRYMYSLEDFVIPNTVKSIGNYAFSTCYGLKEITIPDGTTSIGTYAFQNAYDLLYIKLPSNVTVMNTYAYAYLYCVRKITFHAGLQSISASAFYNCNSVAVYDFSECTAVPTLANTSAFSGILTTCQMLIPSALFDAWSTATNWSTYASKMVAV